MSEFDNSFSNEQDGISEIKTIKQKKKLKKWQKWSIGIVSVPIAVFVILFIIALADTSVANKKSEITESTTSVEDLTFDFGGLKLEYEDAEKGVIDPIPIKLETENLENFEKYLSEIQIDYDYEHLYNIDSVYDRYKKTTVASVEKHSADIRVNGKLDADKLFKTVKANNKKVIEKAFFKSEYSDEKLMEYCRFITKNLPVIFEKYPEIDQDMVCCLLSDLKIIESTITFSSAHVDDELVLSIDEKQTEMNNILIEADDAYTDTFYHELMHICHIGCRDIENSENEFAVGVMRRYRDEKVNPLMWHWLEEGLAEFNKSECRNVPVGTYRTYINYINTLSFLLSLDKEVGCLPLETITCGYDIEKFFSLFDAKTEEDKKDIIRLMFSIEVFQTSPCDFYEIFKEEYNIDLNNDEKAEEDFRMCLKSDILEDFSILFFRNLAREVNRGNVTLQDAYYLIKAFERRICDHFSVKYYKYMIDGKDFFNVYISIRDEFFKILSEDNNFTAKEIKDNYMSYAINAVDGDIKKFPNCDLAFLDKEERKWFAQFIDSFYRKDYPTIEKCIELAEEAEKVFSSEGK